MILVTVVKLFFFALENIIVYQLKKMESSQKRIKDVNRLLIGKNYSDMQNGVTVEQQFPSRSKKSFSS